MPSKDIIIRCTDCGGNFTFGPGEQEYYRERQFDQPKRCPACRKARKDRKAEQEHKA